MAWWIGCAALAHVVLPREAAAQLTDDDQRARQHYEAGEAYYQEGDYEGAVRELRRAYELSHRPQLFYNLYLAQERLGEFAEAAAHLEACLRETPGAADRELLERRLTNLRSRVEGAIAPTEEAPEALLPLGDEPQQTAAIVVPVPVDRGPDGGLVLAGVSALAVGGVGLVVLAVAGGVAAGENDRLAGSCGSRSTGHCRDAQVAGLRPFGTVARLGLGVGLAGVAAGTVLMIVAMTSGGASERTGARVAPRFSPTEAGIQLAGVF